MEISAFFKRNKKIILISLAIFLIFFIAGAVITYIGAGDQVGVISNSMMNLSKSGNFTPGVDIGTSSMDLFIHNLISDLIVIVGGISFSIISLLIVVFNALSLSGIFGLDLTYASVSVLPHAIIEYVATVFSLAAAFLITKIEIEVIRKKSFKNIRQDYEVELRDILIFVIIVVILVLIAAIIEAIITPQIVTWYFHLY